MLGRELLARALEQQITREEDPGLYSFNTNLFEMVGKNLLNNKDVNQALLDAHFGFQINPTENLSIDMQRNVRTPDIPWNQEFRVGVNYQFPVSRNYGIKKSKIHGKGAFALQDFIEGEKIGVALKVNDSIQSSDDVERTPLGVNVNHQENMNTYLKRDGNIHNLHANRDIKSGEELTSDYRDTPWFIDKNVEGYKELP